MFCNTPPRQALGIAVAAADPTPGQKRKIVPTIQAASKRALILTAPTREAIYTSLGPEISIQQYFGSKEIFPNGFAKVRDAFIIDKCSILNRQQHKPATWKFRHILLPYNLRNYDADISEGEVRVLLENIFPGTKNVARALSHLMCYVEDLPEGPWPLTVGGLPLTVQDSHNYGRLHIFPQYNLNPSGISICQEGYSRGGMSDDTLRKLTAEVHRLFKANLPEVEIIEVMLTCEDVIYFIVGDQVNINAIRSKLPGRIASRPVRYLNNHELKRPHLAKHPKNHTIEPPLPYYTIDNNTYDVIRPGAMICSKGFASHARPEFFSTTSGVILKDPAGNHFMTGSSMGIGPMGEVWQAHNSDAIIGRAVREIPSTDICLIQLQDNVQFTNETFENIYGVVTQFKNLAKVEDKSSRLGCHLNSPYTGHIEGSVMASSIRIEGSSHSPENEPRYVAYKWSYMGQCEANGSHIPIPDATRGAAVWGEDGVILGFFHYYISEGRWQGFSIAVSASEVDDAGYTLI